MTNHTHEWFIVNCSNEDKSILWAIAECRNCDAQMHDSIIEERLNEYEVLTAEPTRVDRLMQGYEKILDSRPFPHDR